LEGLELSVELKYEDREGKEVKWPHFFQYSVEKNKWTHLWKDIK
ncbi:unnamed protein product, partial [marine sediment metagenome]